VIPSLRHWDASGSETASACATALQLLLIFFPDREIVGEGGANQILQGRRIDIIAFIEVEGSGVLGIEASVEHTPRIFQRRAVEEV
jgi:hypothetical protein